MSQIDVLLGQKENEVSVVVQVEAVKVRTTGRIHGLVPTLSG